MKCRSWSPSRRLSTFASLGLFALFAVSVSLTPACDEPSKENEDEAASPEAPPEPGPFQRAKIKLVETELKMLESAVELYILLFHEAPASLEDLAEAPDGTRLLREPAIDPWRAPYELVQLDGGKTAIRSLGPDGKPDTVDDITLVVEGLD